MIFSSQALVCDVFENPNGWPLLGPILNPLVGSPFLDFWPLVRFILFLNPLVGSRFSDFWSLVRFILEPPGGQPLLGLFASSEVYSVSNIFKQALIRSGPPVNHPTIHGSSPFPRFNKTKRGTPTRGNTSIIVRQVRLQKPPTQ